MNENFVVSKEGRIYMHTTSPACWPDKATRRALRSAGYKITLGGKPFKEG